MVVVGVLVAGLSFGIKEAIDLYRFLSFHNEIASQGRLALMRMGREIRQITAAETVGSDSFQFVTIEGIRLRYRRLANNDLMRDIDSDLDGTFDNSNILASDVNSLVFTYYAEDNTITTDPANVYRIVIQLTLTRDTQTLTLRSQIYPRNL